MTFVSRPMEDAHMERQWRGELGAVRESIEQRLNALETPERPVNVNVSSPNYLINSHPEWSHKAYTQSGVDSTTAGKDNNQAHNWYYQQNNVTALTDSDTVTSTTGPLCASTHTDFATVPAEGPIWDKVNARMQLGFTTTTFANGFDIAAPLSTNFVFPGQRYYVYFETLLNSSTVDLEDAEFYCGFWDNTASPTLQQKWIEGSDFNPTVTVFGVQGTRTLSYKILATTDGGQQILSLEKTVTTAPTVLSADNHVRIFFDGAPGFIRFEVYRKEGSTYRKVADIRNSIDLQFFDIQEAAGSIETGYPVLTGNRPQAKATTNGLTANAETYTVHTMLIEVPTTYDRSKTTNGNQWFRLGLTKAISDARGLVIRRLMVSEGYGPWTRAAADLKAVSSPSSTATSSPGSGTVTGNDPGNGPYCVTMDTLVDVMYQRGEEDVHTKLPIAELDKGMHIVCGAQAVPILHIKDGLVQEIYEITTQSGLNLKCSSSHRLIRSYFDKFGTAARFLKVGDKVLTALNNAMTLDIVTSIQVHYGSTPVRTITIPKPNLYITNGIVSHNTKLPPE